MSATLGVAASSGILVLLSLGTASAVVIPKARVSCCKPASVVAAVSLSVVRGLGIPSAAFLSIECAWKCRNPAQDHKVVC